GDAAQNAQLFLRPEKPCFQSMCGKQQYVGSHQYGIHHPYPLMMTQEKLTDKALELLKQLISIPSFSGEEDLTADAIETFLREFGVETGRQHNNVYAFN